MAEGDLHLRPRESAARRELEPGGALPYARHVTDSVIALDTQALMISFQLDGASFETADIRDLNDWHAKLNGAWRNIAIDQLAVWHHLVRREHDGYPEGEFRSDFARALDGRYRERLGGGRMFVNELYLTLVLHPGRDAADRLGAWLSRAKVAPVDEAERVRLLEDAARDLAQYLARYGVRPLGLERRDGVWFSQPLEMLRLILTGRHEPVPLVRGHLGSAVYSARVIFGREALEVRDAASARFGGTSPATRSPSSPSRRRGRSWSGSKTRCSRRGTAPRRRSTV